MFAHLPHRGPHPHATARQAASTLRRLAAALAAVICAALASAAVAPAAWAMNVDPARRASPGARGHRGRHARLADHPDRPRRRPGRGRRRRPAGPGASRPPGSLRDHRMTRPRPP